MHYVTAKGILSSKNGMNLYRGCQHGCIYCDSRSECYHMDHDFEDIEVKENALVLLEAYMLDSPRGRELMSLFHRRCQSAGILYDNDRIFQYLSQFEEKTMPQMSLF